MGAGGDSEIWRVAGSVDPMPAATRVRVPEKHINAFLYSEFVVPLVMDFLAARSLRAAAEAT